MSRIVPIKSKQLPDYTPGSAGLNGCSHAGEATIVATGAFNTCPMFAVGATILRGERLVASEPVFRIPPFAETRAVDDTGLLATAFGLVCSSTGLHVLGEGSAATCTEADISPGQAMLSIVASKSWDPG